jgi:hypothetical protein
MTIVNAIYKSGATGLDIKGLEFCPIFLGGDKEVYEIDCIRVAARIPC